MQKARLGIDVGGTFTDTFLELPDGRSLSDKRLTTADAPDDAILAAVTDSVARAGLRAGDVGAIVHGTTLATNAVIERRGARTALITTEGFRDVLEMGREDRHSQYDLNLQKPAPLVPRRLRFAVAGRIAADGAELLPLDHAALTALAGQLRAAEVESAAICFINSYVNPAHEQAARDILRALLPDLPLSLSCEVAPVIREHERFTTTAANAYVQPLIGRYLDRLAVRLDAAGFGCPRLLMLSSGTLCDFDTSRRFPVRLIESGPAGGAIFAAHLAARHGVDEAMAFDLGGTTAKMTLIDGGAPRLTALFEAAREEKFVRGSGLPLRVPSVDLLEIGAGGGSVAHLDALGRLRVGPEGTGSMPGPACYGHGGALPTVTDANLLLGRVSADTFAGGTVPLYPDLAARAVERLAVTAQASPPEPLAEGQAGGDSTAHGPRAIVAAVDEAMALAARLHAVENGADPARRTLIAFGGGGPLHAASIAGAIGAGTILVPPDAGVGSAVGFLRAGLAFEVTRSALYQLGSAAPGLADLAQRIEAEARAIIGLADPSGTGQTSWRAAMRYCGQGHEVQVAIPAPLASEQLLRAAFEAEYQRLFGRTIAGIGVEVVSWTCRIGIAVPEAGRVSQPPASTPPVPMGSRLVAGAAHAALPHALYDRAALRPGQSATGPCLVEEVATTTAVPPGWELLVLSDLTLKLTRSKGAARV